MEEKDVLVKIGALWTKPKSMQGKMGDARLVVMPNSYKQSDNHPDYIVYVCKPKKKEEPTDEPPF